jgi:major vault protein
MSKEREQDILLSPNEYAFVQETTKGHIELYVGPHKVTLSTSERMVKSDPVTGKIYHAGAESGVQQFIRATTSQYIVLENPLEDKVQDEYVKGGNASKRLTFGKRVVKRGPATFALWPGQVANVIDGHELQEDEFLKLRTYDTIDEAVEGEGLEIGTEKVIRGSETRFFIPTTGWEVVREGSNYVRKAVKLEEGQYCQLRRSTGKKRHVRGPEVVFPNADEVFVIGEGGVYVRQALKLEEGEYCQLLASTGDKRHVEGPKVVFPEPNESFVEGDNGDYVRQALRLEEGEYCQLLKSTGEKRNVSGPAVVFPDANEVFVPGEERQDVRTGVKLQDGQYCVLLNTKGEKRYVQGPEVVFPEVNEQFQENRLRQKVYQAKTLKPEEGLHLSATKDFEIAEGDELAEIVGLGTYRIGQEIFVRGKEGLFFPNENLKVVREVNPIPLADDTGVYVRNKETGEIRTVKGPKNFLHDPTKEVIVSRNLEAELEELYGVEGRDSQKAVSVYVPPNEAMMVVSGDKREVVQGPKHRVLDFTEDLENLALSTGTPKTDKKRLDTVFLKVCGNRISDVVSVETRDHVPMDIKFSYRVNFEGPEEKWFDEKDYVGLLCDHLSSVIRSVVKGKGLDEFNQNTADIIRDAVLGAKPEEGERKGRLFSENGMRAYDVEVLKVDVLNEEVAEMLETAQQKTFEIGILNQQRELQTEMEKRQDELQFELTQASERIQQDTLALKVGTLESQLKHLGTKREVDEYEATTHVGVDRMSRVGMAESVVAANVVTYEHEKARADDTHQRDMEYLKEKTATVVQRLNAISPRLAAAIERFGDQKMVIEAVSKLGDMALLKDQTVIETLKQIFGSNVNPGSLEMRTDDVD